MKIRKVQTRVIVTGILFCSAILAEEKISPRERLEAKTDAALALADEADHYVEFTGTFNFSSKTGEITIDPLLQIGVGTIKNGLFYPKSFKLDELSHYFSIQKHKDLVYICLPKNAWPDKMIRENIEMLNSYFFECGYKRVVIQQHHSQTRISLSDKINPHQKTSADSPAEPNKR